MNLSVGFSKATHGTPAMARAIACGLMLLVLPSCGIPPLRSPQPAPPLPPDNMEPAAAANSAQLGIEDFYTDPRLTCLIEKALADNRELRNLNEDVAIASNEVLARSGAYLPFMTVGATSGLNRVSHYVTEYGAIRDDPYLPGRYFPNPLGDFLLGLNFTWQLDIYRQLRNARDSAWQRFNVASERRNFFVTQLVADIAENYYRLMALDKRIENLNQIIELQEQSLKFAQSMKEFARGTELAVLRFQAEVQRNQSEKLIVNQDIVVTENRINYLVNRYPQPVDRSTENFFDVKIHALEPGVPSQLLLYRPDVREAERELVAAGLDVKVARVNFFPQLVVNSGVSLAAFSMRYLFEPNAVAGNIIGGLTGPFVNRRAIKAQYLSANARQLQAVYNYQRTLLNAFTEVVNRLTQVDNFSRSVAIKKEQMRSLEAAVGVASNLFELARTGYLDVLLAQRDLRDARVALIETKTQQLTAIVDTYQALGGGAFSLTTPVDFRGQFPYTHTVRCGETYETLSLLYYGSTKYHRALWAASKSDFLPVGPLPVGTKIVIPRRDRLDASLIEKDRAPAPDRPGVAPADKPADPPPPPGGAAGPFDQKEPVSPDAGGNDDARPPAAAPIPEAARRGPGEAQDPGTLPPLPPPARRPGAIGREVTEAPADDADAPAAPPRPATTGE